MQNILILLVGSCLLAGLLLAEKKDSIRGKLLTKPVLTMLVIITAIIQAHPLPGYFQFVLVALILCLLGDTFLIFPKTFLPGLIAFLLGHILYVAAFIKVAQFTGMAGLIAAAVVFVSLGIFWKLRPHLGSMLGPVVFYMLVITAMVIGAGAVMVSGELNLNGRLLVMVGALLFYISDIFVARHRFVDGAYLNRLLGLPLYYSGQFMLAFSVGLLV